MNSTKRGLFRVVKLLAIRPRTQGELRQLTGHTEDSIRTTIRSLEAEGMVRPVVQHRVEPGRPASKWELCARGFAQPEPEPEVVDGDDVDDMPIQRGYKPAGQWERGDGAGLLRAATPFDALLA